MPSLKDLKNRINSVKSTQKITKAMQMVAAAKLRRAQDAAVAARPYAERMEKVLAGLGAAYEGRPDAPALLAGTGKDDVHLLVVATGERGLAGGFNSSIARMARDHATRLLAAGKTVKILTVVRQGAWFLKRGLARLTRRAGASGGNGQGRRQSPGGGHRRARPCGGIQLLDRPHGTRPRHAPSGRRQDRQDPDGGQEGRRCPQARPCQEHHRA